MAVSDPHVIAEFMNSLEKKLDILRESYAENGGFEKLAAESAEAMNGGSTPRSYPYAISIHAPPCYAEPGIPRRRHGKAPAVRPGSTSGKAGLCLHG